MVSILKASGFQNLESLKEFCDRFPDVSYCLDNDLQKIWICHKNCQKIPKFEEISSCPSDDYKSLAKIIRRKIAAEKSFYSLLTEFSAFSIFEKLYRQFGNQLTTYLVTTCYIFYNWGINSFEPVFDHFEIHEIIQERQKRRRMPSRRLQHNFINLNNVNLKKNSRNKNEEVMDLFECNQKYTKPKSVGIKSLVQTFKKTKKFYEFTKNPRNPYQEMFTLNKILYDMKQRSRLSKNHVLALKNVNDLILFIIRIPVATDNCIENKLFVEYKKWKKLKLVLQHFMNNQEKLNNNNGYGRILKRHLKNVKVPGKKMSPIPTSKVCTYMSHILRIVLPFELFGSSNMKRNFITKVIKVIKGNKKETFIWHGLLHMILMKKNVVPWIKQIDNYYIQSQVVLKVFKFIIFHYVFEILRNNFYVTETGSSGFSLRYYCKCDMESASTVCINSLLKNENISYLKKCNYALSVEGNWLKDGVIAKEDLRRKLKIKMSPDSEYCQPVAHVRFLPKSDDGDALRIITCIPKKHSKNNKLKSESKRLIKFFNERKSQRKKTLFFVKLFLEYLVNKKGFGICPLPSDSRLEDAWKRAVHLNEIYGKLYFVKADISDAFNSVKYSILTEILRLAVEKELENKKVKLRKIIEWRKRSWKIHKEVRFGFSNRPRENSVMIQRSFSLDSNKIINRRFDLKFLKIIKQVAMQQKIEINGDTFKLKRGLAQGSAGRFSPQLCEIYYSSMDRLFFGEFIDSKDSILLRAVDDYLFISSDIRKAERFLKIVRNGIREYNVKFNHYKLKSNLIKNIQEVTYLGLVFNFKSMAVKPDYSKYYQNGFLSTINLSDRGGSNHFNKELFLRKRVLCMKCLKLNPIVINEIHNNLKVVRQTVFEACRLQSLRVITLADYLYSDNVKDNFAVYSILLISCTRIRKLAASTDLPTDEFNWLFFFAASAVLRKYSGHFELLIKLIRYRLQQCENAFANNGAQALINFLKNDILDDN